MSYGQQYPGQNLAFAGVPSYGLTRAPLSQSSTYPPTSSTYPPTSSTYGANPYAYGSPFGNGRGGKKKVGGRKSRRIRKSKKRKTRRHY